jgi:hypothetical protein
MRTVLIIAMIFGAGALSTMVFRRMRWAVTQQLRGGQLVPVPDPRVYEELDQLRQEMSELQERVDFAERLLAAHRDEIGRVV